MDFPRQPSASKTNAANVLCSFSPPCANEPASIPKPIGPSPKNSIWDSVMGCWVKKVNKNKTPQIIFKTNDITNNKIVHPCPYPRKRGHTWDFNKGQWIKNINDTNIITKPPYSCPYPRKAGHTWNSNTGKWIKNNQNLDIKKTIKKTQVYHSIAEQTRTNKVNNTNEYSVNNESLHKLNKLHVPIQLPISILAKYNGEDGNWLSSGKIKKIIVEWDDGDTKHTTVNANEVYYDPMCN